MIDRQEIEIREAMFKEFRKILSKYMFDVNTQETVDRMNYELNQTLKDLSKMQSFFHQAAPVFTVRADYYNKGQVNVIPCNDSALWLLTLDSVTQTKEIK
jgi:uncharacterized membrane protein